MMDAKVEDKHLLTQLEVNVQHNSAIGAGDVISICPSPSFGTGDFNRIGARITPKYLYVKGSIAVVRTGMVINRPIGLRVLAFNQNDVKNYDDSGNVETGLLLRGFAGSSVAYDGGIAHHLLPMNDELFKKIYDKTFKLSEQNSANAFGAEGSDTRGSEIHFSFKVKCPKTLKYDNASTHANNFAPFMAIGYCFLDGTTPDIASTNVLVNTIAHLKYEDA